MLLCPLPRTATQNDPFVFLAACPRITVFGLYVCLSVRLFQGGLSGETESGHRLPDKRRLQKRHGRTHPGETDKRDDPRDRLDGRAVYRRLKF